MLHKGSERVGEFCEKAHDDDKSKNNSNSDAPLSGDSTAVKAGDAIIDSSNPTLKYTGEESQDEVIDESGPCNKDQVYTKMFEGQNKPMSDECQRRTEDCSTDPLLVATPLPKENNVLLHKMKRIDIQEEKKEREMNDSLIIAIETDAKQVLVGKDCTAENQTLVAKKPQSGESTLKSSCFPMNKAIPNNNE